jgi:hypothetical protein
LNEAQASKEEKSATATKAHEAETETSATEPVSTVSQTEAQQLVLKKSDKEQEPKTSKQRGEPKIPNPNYGNEACSEASRSGNSNYPITNLPTYPIQTGPIQMMSDLEKLIANHLVCTESQRVILALWILHTYTCEATPLTPYLNISSPLEESGKSTCMTILRGLCADPWWPVGLTPANFQRKINEDHPTVLLDNWQTLFRGTDRNKITGFLLSGCDQPPDFNDGDEAGTEAYPSDSNSGAETCAEDDSNYPITNLPNPRRVLSQSLRWPGTSARDPGSPFHPHRSPASQAPRANPARASTLAPQKHSQVHLLDGNVRRRSFRSDPKSVRSL